MDVGGLLNQVDIQGYLDASDGKGLCVEHLRFASICITALIYKLFSSVGAWRAAGMASLGASGL